MEYLPATETPSSEERLDLRLEMRVKNNLLWHAIYDRFGSVSRLLLAVPELIKDAMSVHNLLNFRVSPRRKDGQYRKAALALEKALQIPVEDLFPDHLYEQITESTRVVEVSSFTALPTVVRKEIALLPAPTEAPEFAVSRDELRDTALLWWRSLRPNQKRVLQERFGFDDDLQFVQLSEGMTLPHAYSRVAEVVGRSLQRVRVIVRDALWKLFHRYGRELSGVLDVPRDRLEGLPRSKSAGALEGIFLNILELCAHPK